MTKRVGGGGHDTLYSVDCDIINSDYFDKDSILANDNEDVDCESTVCWCCSRDNGNDSVLTVLMMLLVYMWWYIIDGDYCDKDDDIGHTGAPLVISDKAIKRHILFCLAYRTAIQPYAAVIPFNIIFSLFSSEKQKSKSKLRSHSGKS